MDKRVVGYEVIFGDELSLAKAIDLGVLNAVALLRPVVAVRPVVANLAEETVHAIAQHEILQELRNAPVIIRNAIERTTDRGAAGRTAIPREGCNCALVALDGAYYEDAALGISLAISALVGGGSGEATTRPIYAMDDWQSVVREQRDALFAQIADILCA